MDGFSEIEWENEGTRYPWPLPPDVAARIEATATVVDDRCLLVGVHPDDASGWYCLHPGPGVLDGLIRVECSEDGDGDPVACWVRFGVAPFDVFDRMREHDGW